MTSPVAIIRSARLATLATLEESTHHPYGSLIAVATETDGSPLFLISQLARHTQHLKADSRACLLMADDPDPKQPLDIGRISVMGVAEPVESPLARRRFLARHPGAAGYVDFQDFGFWRLRVERAHHVGGFGRIAWLARDDLLVDRETVRDWDAEIDSLIERLNASEVETINALAGPLEASAGDGWRLAACDPDGCDLVCGERSVRLAFRQRLDHPDGIAGALRALTSEERRGHHK